YRGIIEPSIKSLISAGSLCALNQHFSPKIIPLIPLLSLLPFYLNLSLYHSLFLALSLSPLSVLDCLFTILSHSRSLSLSPPLFLCNSLSLSLSLVIFPHCLCFLLSLSRSRIGHSGAWLAHSLHC